MTATLSGRWAAAHHRLLGTTTDRMVRLALALNAVKAAVRVVDRTVPPLSVDWSSVDDDAPVKGASYTDIKGHSIHLNPMPLMDTRISNGEALDICIGFGLHEASHSQESRDRFRHLVKREAIKRPSGDPAASPEAARQYRTWDDLVKREGTIFAKNGDPTREVPAFEPMRIAAYLWNLVEDVRIERVTSGHWPGFEPYFDRVLAYMWSTFTGILPTEYNSDLRDRLQVVYLACRYPARFSPTEPELKAEIDWWQAWQHDYLTDTVDTPTTIQRGLDHLAEDVTTAMQMRAEAGAERQERELGERVRAQIDRLIHEGVPGTTELCITDQGEVIPLDAETSETVKRLVREHLIEVRPVVTVSGAAPMPVLVRKPTETARSKRAYIGRPDPMTEALRAALVFRPSAPQHDEKLLRAGQIDDEELYRWGMGDMRVFGERVVESKPDVFMGLLVDISGSMAGDKLDIAQRLAQLFVFAVHDQPGITTGVWAHTADVDAKGAHVFRIFEPGDPMSRLGLLEELPHANNADGFAVEYVASKIATYDQPEKVLVVLSDGIPQAGGYGGRTAFAHVRAVSRWAAARGVRVIQVAIDPDDIRPEEQVAMYGSENVVLFRGYDALPRQIAAILGRYLG